MTIKPEYTHFLGLAAPLRAPLTRRRWDRGSGGEKSRRLSRKSGGIGGESGQLLASGCGEGLRRPRRPLARALRALSEFSFFCLHLFTFRLQSVDL